MSLEELTGPALRRQIEATIEALIAQLDELDGDFDLEEDGTEHDASWPDGRAGAFNYDRMRGFEHEDTEEDDPAEPALGWPESRTGITPAGYVRNRGGAPADLDLEYDECEREEGEDLEGDELDALEGDEAEDREPALGWNAEASQAHLMGGVSAYEDEPSLAASNPSGIDYSWPRGLKGFWPQGWYTSGDASQEQWGHPGTGQTDAEEEHDGREPENEHGGDVLDERHDAEDEDTGVADMDALLAEDFLPGMADTVRDAQFIVWRNSEWSTAATIDGENYRHLPIVSSCLPGLPAI